MNIYNFKKILIVISELFQKFFSLKNAYPLHVQVLFYSHIHHLPLYPLLNEDNYKNVIGTSSSWYMILEIHHYKIFTSNDILCTAITQTSVYK